jgi:hypothetical protein
MLVVKAKHRPEPPWTVREAVLEVMRRSALRRAHLVGQRAGVPGLQRLA